MGNDQTAIAARTLPLGIESSDDAWRHAKRLSTSGLVPDSLKGKPDDVMIVLMMGRRLGLEPDQSIQAIHVVKGKPVLSSDLIVAQCLRHRDVCAYFIPATSTSERAEYETQRVGAPRATVMVYTIEDAKRAGLTAKDNWKNHPAAMLRARCAAALARATYPDLVLGLYTPDEIDDDSPGTTTLVTQAPPRTVEATQTQGKGAAGFRARLAARSAPPATTPEADAAFGPPPGPMTAEEMADIAAAEREPGSDDA